LLDLFHEIYSPGVICHWLILISVPPVSQDALRDRRSQVGRNSVSSRLSFNNIFSWPISYKIEVKDCMRAKWPIRRTLSWFLWNEFTRRLPGWDASPS